MEIETMAVNFIDETGKKFWKLTVIKQAGKVPSGRARWVCKCECGNVTEVEGKNLRSGMTRSCGCMKLSWNKKWSRTTGRQNVLDYYDEDIF
jgi:hypothetical protein